MKKNLKLAIAVFALALAIASPLAPSVIAGKTIQIDDDNKVEYIEYYQDKRINTGSASGGETKVEDRVKIIINTLLTAVGIISVVMIIWGGITYSSSAGDPGKVELAKRIIIAAIIGLVLSLLAFLILNVVIEISQGGTI